METLSFAQILLIAAGAFAAGAMNAMAGGGTFFSFPALLAVGVPPVTANASNTVALWPASLSGIWAYRKEAMRHGRWAMILILVSLLGGLCGGLLLLATSNAAFSRLVPWLLLIATLLFTFSRQVAQGIQGLKNRLQNTLNPLKNAATSARFASQDEPRHEPGSLGGAIFQFVVAVYGGFFGAGMGILTLAALSIQGYEDMQELNALKNLTSGVNYTVSALTFILAGAVSWSHTSIMLVAAFMGGYAGASLARRLPNLWLKRLVIAVGSVLTLIYFGKTYF